MFHHIMMKCGWNGAGSFTNPEAVFEPVSVTDIEGVENVIVAQDYYDAMGGYKNQQPLEGCVRGLTTKEGLPYYRFYINVGGTRIKRTFIPQNPNKTNADGSLSKWTQAVRNGNAIFMLLGENGPTADIQLYAGQALGQERFKIWQKK